MFDLVRWARRRWPRRSVAAPAPAPVVPAAPRERGVFVEPWPGPNGEHVLQAVAGGRLIAAPILVPPGQPARLAAEIAVAWELVAHAERQQIARLGWCGASQAAVAAAVEATRRQPPVPLHPGLADVRDGRDGGDPRAPGAPGAAWTDEHPALVALVAFAALR